MIRRELRARKFLNVFNGFLLVVLLMYVKYVCEAYIIALCAFYYVKKLKQTVKPGGNLYKYIYWTSKDHYDDWYDTHYGLQVSTVQNQQYAGYLENPHLSWTRSRK